MENDYPLSGTDIKEALHGRVNILRASELSRYTSIDDVLSPWGAAVILYEHEPGGVGHWVTVVRLEDQDHPTIAYADPYGREIDDVIVEQSKAERAKVGQYAPTLSFLLATSNPRYIIDYMDSKLQGKNSSVCGRYSILRAHPSTRALSNDALAELLEPSSDDIKRGLKTADKKIIALTEPLLRH